MAGSAGTITLADLTPVAAEAGAAEGNPDRSTRGLARRKMRRACSARTPRPMGARPDWCPMSGLILPWACGTPAPAHFWGLCKLPGLDRVTVNRVSPTSGPRTAAPGSPRDLPEAACASGTATTCSSSMPYRSPVQIPP
jgi:hypothetical protein